MTFSRALQTHNLGFDCPTDRLILSSGAPGEPPSDLNGGKKGYCHSGHLLLVAAKLAELRKSTVDEVVEIATTNFKQLYGLVDDDADADADNVDVDVDDVDDVENDDDDVDHTENKNKDEDFPEFLEQTTPTLDSDDKSHTDDNDNTNDDGHNQHDDDVNANESVIERP